jgi:hypothetical protein
MPITASPPAAGKPRPANWQRGAASWQNVPAGQLTRLESAKIQVTIAREVAPEATITRVPTALQRVAQSGPDAGAPAARGDHSDRNKRMPAPAGVTLEQCRQDSPLFVSPLVAAAGAGHVDQRDLRVRALLQLPRVASATGLVTAAQIERELKYAAIQLARDAAAARSSVPREKFALHELRFTDSVDVTAAGTIFGHLHYLRNVRPGCEYFALVDPEHGLPVTICAVAPLEWKRVASWVRAQFDVDPGRVRDVARVFSCSAAPANAVSYLLARVRASLARHDAADLLTTVVDTNLGFTGASYRAANWQRWIAIRPRPYLYLDRRYVSPRQLRERFGTANLAELRAANPGHRFEASRARLRDSLIFGCHVGATRDLPPLRDFPTRPLHR